MTNPIIKINVKDFGTMTAELYPEKAPKTVANFVKLAEEGFFSGLIFHRVIKGFMIQGGGYTEDMADKDTDIETKRLCVKALERFKYITPEEAAQLLFYRTELERFITHDNEAESGRIS